MLLLKILGITFGIVFVLIVVFVAYLKIFIDPPEPYIKSSTNSSIKKQSNPPFSWVIVTLGLLVYLALNFYYRIDIFGAIHNSANAWPIIPVLGGMALLVVISAYFTLSNIQNQRNLAPYEFVLMIAWPSILLLSMLKIHSLGTLEGAKFNDAKAVENFAKAEWENKIRISKEKELENDRNRAKRKEEEKKEEEKIRMSFNQALPKLVADITRNKGSSKDNFVKGLTFRDLNTGEKTTSLVKKTETTTVEWDKKENGDISYSSSVDAKKGEGKISVSGKVFVENKDIVKDLKLGRSFNLEFTFKYLSSNDWFLTGAERR